MRPTLRSLSITLSSLLACLQHLPQIPVTVRLSLLHLSLLSLMNCFTVSSSDRPSDRFSYSFCYELTPLVLFRTANWDCRLNYYTRVTIHRTALSLPRGLTPWDSVTASHRAIASPCRLPRPVLLPHPVSLPRPVDCLALCYLPRPVRLPCPDHFRYYINPVLHFEKP